MQFLQPQFRLYLATDGFGCRFECIGTKIYCVCLADGEKAQYRREDFVGLVDEATARSILQRKEGEPLVAARDQQMFAEQERKRRAARKKANKQLREGRTKQAATSGNERDASAPPKRQRRL